MDKEKEIQLKFDKLSPYFDEKSRRLWAGTEALMLGRGGVSLVSRATGLTRPTIIAGREEIKNTDTIAKDRIRRQGGGRKRTIDKDKTFKSDLENLIEPVTRGDPESPLRWSAKSVRKLSEGLVRKQHNSSRELVRRTLKDMDYSLQANRKTNEGKKDYPDRNDQFEYINERTKKLQNSKQPVISVDTKKKENMGKFNNNGKE